MQFEIRIKPRALKDGQRIPKQELARIFEKIEALQNDLAGDVKRLTDTTNTDCALVNIASYLKLKTIKLSFTVSGIAKTPISD